ncbi:S-methyl-5-thioribose-1-phosphate isomerase [Egibacter rhizosphaerae]|uniref:Methylthioribose-1-phosphate isomerase n=1 Tax=Egibacter rhizosphaerae TaxID=1670831 RepID=A0A411YDC0_9ACTN|nr:S-methyl-5-thioribose-1-phosphate isomerase [Egibacter rhizosphaerae]QBI19200.1 S-methyl-5-thioribose-1-phosphate isomerase [Egibacter rhizosphaerae]
MTTPREPGAGHDGAPDQTDDLFAVAWVDDPPAVRLLDQTRLPGEVHVIDCRDLATLAEAIRSLRVRGAPALGVAGAYGVVLGALTGWSPGQAAAELAAQRPTAVNLGWAAERIAARGNDPRELLAAARELDEANAVACRAMGRHGADLIGELAATPARVLTHCNTGMLACQGIGTAFGVARTLHEDGRLSHLWVDETRPLLQGARLTAYEAAALDMPHAVLADAAAGSLLGRAHVDAIVVGSDRIAANGDVANKIGTYPLAVLAARHGVPFLVVAPVSTIDPATPDGAAIPIEERAPDEVRRVLGQVDLTPAGSDAANPAFDVTPAELVTAIVTERGVIRDPDTDAVAAHLAPSTAARD